MRGPPNDLDLVALREEIARIDHALIHLLAARVGVARQAIRLRGRDGEGPTDGAQEALVLDRARTWAYEVGLPPEFVAGLLQAIVEAGKHPSDAWEASPRGRPSVVA